MQLVRPLKSEEYIFTFSEVQKTNREGPSASCVVEAQTEDCSRSKAELRFAVKGEIG